MSTYRTLFEIGKALVAETDLDTLLPILMDKVIEQTGAERGMITVLGDQGELLFETARHLDKKDLAKPEFEISRTIIQSVLKSGEYVVIKNALDDPLFTASASISRLQLLSVACAPLREAGKSFGVIYIDNRDISGVFAEDTGRLLSEFAELIAVSVKSLLERRRAMSEAAQKDVKLRRQVERLRQLEERLAQSEGYDELKGLKSLAMLEVVNQIEKVARTDSPVLIIGETGAGKELIARELYRKSLRREQPFIPLNCAALPDENLLVSELFGHTKGAFTGAEKEKAGVFEIADGGTIFLDEIAKTSLPFQTKLLRVLESGEFCRLGEIKIRKTNVRLVSAASPDLPELIKKGGFYPDLYYRLESFVIRVPALRERREDILELAEHFLRKFTAEHKRNLAGFSAEALDRLLRYHWPGNVRELRNAINRAVILAEQDKIEAGDLPHSLLEASGDLDSNLTASNFSAAKLRAIEAFERDFITKLLTATHGNISEAARRSGMYKKNLIDKLKQYGIKREDFV